MQLPRLRVGKDRAGVGAVLLTTGSALISLAKGLPLFVGEHSTVVIVSGMVLVLLGIILTLGRVRLRYSRILDHYRARILRPDEVPGFQLILDQFAPGEVTTVDQKQSLVRINSELFYAVESVTRVREIVGYFSVFPLRKHAVDELESGKRSRWYGDQPQKDIAFRSSRPTAYYVGFLWGKNRGAKAATVDLLRREIIRRAGVQHTFKVITRPMTPDGVRLARRHKFVEVNQRGEPRLGAVCSRVFDPESHGSS